jgi:hypothetical protein
MREAWARWKGFQMIGLSIYTAQRSSEPDVDLPPGAQMIGVIHGEDDDFPVAFRDVDDVCTLVSEMRIGHINIVHSVGEDARQFQQRLQAANTQRELSAAELTFLAIEKARAR